MSGQKKKRRTYSHHGTSKSSSSSPSTLLVHQVPTVARIDKMRYTIPRTVHTHGSIIISFVETADDQKRFQRKCFWIFGQTCSRMSYQIGSTMSVLTSETTKAMDPPTIIALKKSGESIRLAAGMSYAHCQMLAKTIPLMVVPSQNQMNL